MAHIDYFYSAHSAYAYLGARKLYEICKARGATLTHRPILLSPVVEAAGGLSFAARTQAHVDYFFGREIERWAEWRGLPVINFRPTHHDNPLDLPNGVIIAAQEQGGGTDDLAFAILEAHWRDDADIANPSVLERIAAGCGFDAEVLLAAAQTARVQSIQQQNTDAAIELNVFGSPTYIVDGDMFYGQDRLDMVEQALRVPFGAPNWSNPPVSA